MRTAEINIQVSGELEKRILNKSARIGIVGLGYTGLPLAVEFAKSGYSVTGVDIDADRVNGVQTGRSYLADVDDAVIRNFVRKRKLLATDRFSVVANLDVVNICVPTPLKDSREPDLSHVISATRAIAEHLSPGKLIILESTTYPGTTEDVVRPILEESGLQAGKDFFLGYSPERIDPGNKKYNVQNTPKIVGGVTPLCLRCLKLLYEQVVDTVVPVSSPGTAELAKLFENIFRNVNIALVNELALICDRLDLNVWEVIAAAATKPFGFMKFYPGPGLGGHCIPVDPFYLSWKARSTNFYTEFIELAGKINENMPYYVLSKITDALNSQKKSLNSARVFLIGVAYKKDIADVRESPAFKLIKLLEQKGAFVSYHDPFVPVLPLNNKTYVSQTLTGTVLSQSDCIVIVTDHSGIDYNRIAKKAKLIVDTRNALAENERNDIFKI